MKTKQMLNQSDGQRSPGIKKDVIWVQCEKPLCMKWRKIPADHCDDLSDVSWFCHMNPNEEFNECDASQEKMCVPCGETVVYSQLDVGTLVWAKMSGYCR